LLQQNDQSGTSGRRELVPWRQQDSKYDKSQAHALLAASFAIAPRWTFPAVSMSRKLLLALLFSSVLAFACVVRAEDVEAEVDDDDEDDDDEERAHLIVRRTGERSRLMARDGFANRFRLSQNARSRAGVRAAYKEAVTTPLTRRPPLPPSLPSLQWLMSGRWRASRQPSPYPSTMRAMRELLPAAMQQCAPLPCILCW
jgi:hypothetical protein